MDDTTSRAMTICHLSKKTIPAIRILTLSEEIPWWLSRYTHAGRQAAHADTNIVVADSCS